MSGRSGKSSHLSRSEKKRKDIEKSLIHRANLKKKYFKLLEKEGEHVPEKKKPNEEEGETNSKKPMTYGERYELVKKRKEQRRAQTLEAIQAQKKALEEKKKEREQQRKKLTKKTRTGQPAFAPRINNLLEKVKRDLAKN